MLKELFEEKYGISLGERIGTESSYGVVYVMPQKSRIVKIFYAKSDEHANREIAISTIMGENGIGPNLYNAGKMKEDYYYMVMERISGDLLTMPRWLRKKYEPQINDQIRKLMTKMHKLGYIHGDLKWDNIGYKNMKQSVPKIYIIDFGISIKFPRDIRTNVNIAEGIARVYRSIGFRPRNFVKSPKDLSGALKRAMEEIRQSSARRTKTLNVNNIMTAALNVVNNKPLKVSIPKDKRVPSLPSKKKMVMSPLNPPYNELFNGGPPLKRVPPPKVYEPLTFANELIEVLSVPLNPNWKPSTPEPSRFASPFDPNVYRPYAPPTPPFVPEPKKSPELTVTAKSINEKFENIKKTPEIRGNVELRNLLDELALSYVALLKLSYIETKKGKLTKKQMADRDELRRGRDNLRKAIKRRFDKYNIKNVELL